MRIKICKLFLATIGKVLPLKRHWGGILVIGSDAFLQEGLFLKWDKAALLSEELK